MKMIRRFNGCLNNIIKWFKKQQAAWKCLVLGSESLACFRCWEKGNNVNSTNILSGIDLYVWNI